MGRFTSISRPETTGSMSTCLVSPQLMGASMSAIIRRGRPRGNLSTNGVKKHGDFSRLEAHLLIFSPLRAVRDCGILCTRRKCPSPTQNSGFKIRSVVPFTRPSQVPEENSPLVRLGMVSTFSTSKVPRCRADGVMRPLTCCSGSQRAPSQGHSCWYTEMQTMEAVAGQVWSPRVLQVRNLLREARPPRSGGLAHELRAAGLEIVGGSTQQRFEFSFRIRLFYNGKFGFRGHHPSSLP